MLDKHRTIAGLAALSVSAFPAGELHAANPVELEFIDHFQADMIEQDVFVEKIAGSDEVYRVAPGKQAEYGADQVYATTRTVHHEPFDAGAIGPYPKGGALNMTLAEWLEAEGTATYVCAEGKGTVTASFANLVPDAAYTMWTFFAPVPPTDPYRLFELPLGARDGSQAAFTTDSRAAARYEAEFEPCLQPAGEQLLSGLMLVWHSDGRARGAQPGPYGWTTHVQLFAVLPRAGESASGDVATGGQD